MAKKKAKKVRRTMPANASKQEEVLASVIDDMSDEEVSEIINPDAAFEQPTMVKDDSKGEKKDDDLVNIRVPVHLKIAGKKYPPGVHQVPRHQIATIVEMVDKKRRADLSMFTGKNFLIERLLDRTLVVTEVDEINLKKIGG